MNQLILQKKIPESDLKAVGISSMLAGEGHIGQHIMVAGIHQIGELGPTGRS